MEAGHPPMELEPVDELLRRLQGSTTLAEAARRLVDAVVAVAPGVEHSAVSVLERRRPTILAASGPEAATADGVQCELEAGPCVDALVAAPEVLVPDLTVEQAWPSVVTRLVAETPVRSVLVVRMVHDGRTLGSLSLYAEQPGAFDVAAIDLCRRMARHAAPALGRIAEAEQLRTGLAGRDVIATAKGILMAREGISEEEAFDVLRRASRRTNVKVRDLARSIVGGVALAREPVEPSWPTPEASPTFDQLADRLDPTLVLVTARDPSGRVGGCLVSQHCAAGADPARYAVWIVRGSHTHVVVAEAGHLAVHHLAVGDEPLAADFGSGTAATDGRFARHAVVDGPFGVPLLAACATRVVGRIVARHDDGGDHVGVVVEPLALDLAAEFTPLRRSGFGRWWVQHDSGSAEVSG